jgi:hypothetical protein
MAGLMGIFGKINRLQHVRTVTRVLLPVLILLLVVTPVQSLAFTGLQGTSPGGYAELSAPGSTTGYPYTADAAVPGIKAAVERTITIPVRQNRTPLIQSIEKNVIQRPKVEVPVFWLVILFIIALAGVCALLYVLIRGRYAAAGRKRDDRKLAQNKTVIGPEGSRVPAGEVKKEPQGPAVQFPPSLEKKFIHAEFIGEGGLGRVFRAQNAKTGTTVAVKVPIRFDGATGTHFSRDIFLWQGLHHPNILEVLSYNILPVPYVEMEYAPSSLADMHFPIPEEKALFLIRGIASGLSYAHGKGIIHRDIKPDNILITADGTPKITDWGMAKDVGDTRKSSVIGFSPAYAAPEQVAPKMYGTPGPATDIYQMGVLLYEMLTGTVPFEEEDLHSRNQAVLYDKVPQPSWEGTHKKEIFAIIEKCLKKRPDERYDSVASLIADLERVHIPRFGND